MIRAGVGTFLYSGMMAMHQTSPWWELTRHRSADIKVPGERSVSFRSSKRPEHKWSGFSVLKHTGEALTSVCIPSSCRGIAPEQNVGGWTEQQTD